nr:hypothetical protein CFP56_33606 [Quercus suber]
MQQSVILYVSISGAVPRFARPRRRMDQGGLKQGDWSRIHTHHMAKKTLQIDNSFESPEKSGARTQNRPGTPPGPKDQKRHLVAHSASGPH